MAKKKAGTKKAAGKKSVKKAGTKVKAEKKKEPRVIPTGPKSFDKVSKTRTKSQVLASISDNTGLSKKEVGMLFETLGELIEGEALSRLAGEPSA